MSVDTGLCLNYLIALGDHSFMHDMQARVERDAAYAAEDESRAGQLMIKELLGLNLFGFILQWLFNLGFETCGQD